MTEKEMLTRLVESGLVYDEPGVGLRAGLKPDTPLREVDSELNDALLEFIETCLSGACETEAGGTTKYRVTEVAELSSDGILYELDDGRGTLSEAELVNAIFERQDALREEAKGLSLAYRAYLSRMEEGSDG